MTRLLFDFLVDRLPEGRLRSDIAELRDNNVLMLDLRTPEQDSVVKTIVDGLPTYLDRLDSDLQASLRPGFTELLELATAQHRQNQATTSD
ncbi:hypothetical protein O6P37_25550 [Mycobacterium sp. CPCC 205372]|uniref:Uncharacterized protein n=1 Tax=Mycobacterium hippophais TaxID=3016340 RepID=A0ABT4Q077_9MYCO|nr:hypothetical protein [Mycobacterium hippophais]MCZ8382241.1 hypothetical protein [Mycobacterium hippophais]